MCIKSDEWQVKLIMVSGVLLCWPINDLHSECDSFTSYTCLLSCGINLYSVTGYVRISMVGVQVVSVAVGAVCTKFFCTQFLS